MKQSDAPYKCHLFVCVKTRDDGRKSCGNNNSPELRTVLKQEIKDRGWKDVVRVCESSCLGVCAAGPNIMVYPQKIWFSAVSTDDIPQILSTVEQLLEKES